MVLPINTFSAADISYASSMEEHIFHDFIEGGATREEVLKQFFEFDPWGAAEILRQSVIINKDDLKEFYLDCVLFTNWKINATKQDVEEELKEVTQNYTGVRFLLNVLKTRFLFTNFDEMGLTVKAYILTILNPGSINTVEQDE